MVMALEEIRISQAEVSEADSLRTVIHKKVGLRHIDVHWIDPQTNELVYLVEKVRK